MEIDLVQVLIQGGAIGISIGLLIYMGFKDKLTNTTLNNHLSHIDETMQGISIQMERANNNQTHLVSVLDQNTKVINAVLSKK
ncbi:hypothetical protein LCGC14_0417970 [marine sediment metagenome]|uniref:Uncharacterized protein n=1 Tax=marine sediment metagenome TaxID=412755 RepID=A0A0F9VDS5_9ZZZZ